MLTIKPEAGRIKDVQLGVSAFKTLVLACDRTST